MENGVGVAVRNSMLTLRLNTTAGPATLVSVYAPTMSATSDTNDEFYENLEATIGSEPNNEQVVLMGDVNARVGADHDTWPSCLGQSRVGKLSEIGQQLLELCTYNDMCIANSYAQPWLPPGKIHQRITIDLTPSRPK